MSVFDEMLDAREERIATLEQSLTKMRELQTTADLQRAALQRQNAELLGLLRQVADTISGIDQRCSLQELRVQIEAIDRAMREGASTPSATDRPGT
jgi:hypothetical protein